MKKILLTLLLLLSTIMADSVLLVKKGWQLIGSAVPLDDMSKFQKESVEQVWHFDASTQKWLAYSPDKQIETKIEAKNISKLSKLESWHGFWVKSKKDWSLTLPTSKLSKAPADANRANDTIHLKKGWNLISLPVDIVVSADIFKGMSVWKYNSHRDWEFFGENQKEADGIPKIEHIKNSDGLWVKADKDTDISVIQEASKLHNFKTSKEMEAYIKSSIKIHQRPICGYYPINGNPILRISDETMTMAAPPTSAPMAVNTLEDGGAEAKNASSTNLQESDVDEADIVKHDGVNIFYTQRDQSQRESSVNYINVNSFERLSKGQSKPITQILFTNKNKYINSMYLVDKKLIVLSHLNTYADNEIKNTPEGDVYGYADQHIVVDIFDIADINDIKKTSSYQVDGNMLTSRVVGKKLYLVSNFSPRYNIEYPKEYVTLSPVCKEYFTQRDNVPMPVEPFFTDTNEAEINDAEPKDVSIEKSLPYEPNKYQECYSINKEYKTDKYYRYDYENPILKIIDLMPNIEGSDLAREDLIKPDRLYTSSKQNQVNTITTISTIDIAEGKYKNSNSFIGYSSTQYASSKALYLVSNQYPIYYDFYNYKERSSIYKFNLDNELDYRGVGSVYGHTLNQFSLSEHKDILRIATTEGFSWGGSGTNNSIYTLKEESGLLPIQGVLLGLGKENEVIKSVRFMGDRGYVVTFKQTDPLYTIDLSDPTAPKKMGELKVNGYSAYLHPVGENRLLGIGKDASSDGRVQGIKIELFDISDLQNPSSLDTIILERDTYSELERNHKALAYRASDNLFAFPYRANGNQFNDYKTHNYLGVYQIDDDTLISHKKVESKIQSWGESRGIIFDMNNQTYISFFVNGEVITEKLEEN